MQTHPALAPQPAHVSTVWSADIANPGYGPFFAVHAMVAGRLYVLANPEALFDNAPRANRLAERVARAGVINLNLWERAGKTWEEIEHEWDVDWRNGL